MTLEEAKQIARTSIRDHVARLIRDGVTEEEVTLQAFGQLPTARKNVIISQMQDLLAWRTRVLNRIESATTITELERLRFDDIQ